MAAAIFSLYMCASFSAPQHILWQQRRGVRTVEFLARWERLVHLVEDAP
jgi:hypothetical protein